MKLYKMFLGVFHHDFHKKHESYIRYKSAEKLVEDVVLSDAEFNARLDVDQHSSKCSSKFLHLLKWVSLATLTFQNAILSLSMRYARTQRGELFVSSTAVVLAEVVKLFTCLLILVVQERSVSHSARILYQQIIRQPVDTLKVCVPSLIYTLQNNLIFVAASNLDAATYQVTYQLKILTTALLSVLMLKKSLKLLHWTALFVLLVGVCFVQLAQSSETSGDTGGHEQNHMLGLVAVIASCCMSGFAGVYFEKILKGSEVSVWVRNIQLSLLSIPFALCTTFASGDGAKVRERGFFFGYNGIVWFVVLMYALGGILVAVVVKYADNILKGFATSMAIVVACVASIYMFQFQVTYQFSLGAALVISSVLIYGQQEASVAVKPLIQTSLKGPADIPINI